MNNIKSVADCIYESFLDLIQEAEELGGPNPAEYIDLMEKIGKEAAERAYNARFQRAHLENNPLTNSEDAA